MDAEIDCVVAPVFHEYVYGDVPPLGLAVRVADPPLQTAGEFTLTAGGVFTVKEPEPEPVHPFESVTVTLYVPAVEAEIDCVVDPVLQEYV